MSVKPFISRINYRIPGRNKANVFSSKCPLCNFYSISVLHRVEGMVPYSLLSPRLWIAGRLMNKNTWVRNCNVSQTSLNWFAERKLFVPCSSI